MRAKRPHKKTKRRLGRGIGSTVGKTSGRGVKGQHSRSGSKARLYSEGGQNTIIRRLPKRGFQHHEKKPWEVLNLDVLSSFEKSEVKPEDFVESGLFKKIQRGVKILGNGEIKKALTVHAHSFSASAREKIEKAGGKTVLIERTGNGQREKGSEEKKEEK